MYPTRTSVPMHRVQQRTYAVATTGSVMGFYFLVLTSQCGVCSCKIRFFFFQYLGSGHSLHPILYTAVHGPRIRRYISVEPARAVQVILYHFLDWSDIRATYKLKLVLLLKIHLRKHSASSVTKR